MVALPAYVSGAGRTPDDGYERIGYFPSWTVDSRGYRVRDVVTSGAADRLTQLNYAFGNVGEDGRCSMSEDTDPYADFQRLDGAADSVDGRADTADQRLAGNLGQLRELKRRNPRLVVGVTLGGWNWSRYFSDAARTAESRRAFARSCVDLWIKGNLPRIGSAPQGGPGAAAGVFDAIDIDWEWPAAEGNERNVVRDADRRNYTLLLAELRRALDEAGREAGRRYRLTASLSPDPVKAAAGIEPEIFSHIDFATVQGYDFHGSWSEVTNHHAQLFSPRDDPSPERLSADLAIRTYLAMGVRPRQLVLGVPAFGRGWSGVGPERFGQYQEVNGPAPGGYEPGGDSYRALSRRTGQRFFDPLHGAYWVYDGDAWWTYDDPKVVAMKARYVRSTGLRGLMIWSLEADDPDAGLVRAMDSTLRTG
ncbi:MAG: glycosyl hydrolase [Streptosporangiales bacterium]|nr:glycosyl hydrolase [Streptosporangiales bacterium]